MEYELVLGVGGSGVIVIGLIRFLHKILVTDPIKEIKNTLESHINNTKNDLQELKDRVDIDIEKQYSRQKDHMDTRFNEILRVYHESDVRFEKIIEKLEGKYLNLEERVRTIEKSAKCVG